MTWPSKIVEVIGSKFSPQPKSMCFQVCGGKHPQVDKEEQRRENQTQVPLGHLEVVKS